MGRILVAYATKHGSTREVADAIAGRIREHGLDARLRPASDVDGLDGYDGIVIGGSLYMGRWHADARDFLKRYRAALFTLPIAVFAMGPLKNDESDAEGSRKQLERALAKTPQIEPVSVAIFGGVVDPAKLHFPFSHMDATDARDWDAIHTWADEVTERFSRMATLPA